MAFFFPTQAVTSYHVSPHKCPCFLLCSLPSHCFPRPQKTERVTIPTWSTIATNDRQSIYSISRRECLGLRTRICPRNMVRGDTWVKYVCTTEICIRRRCHLFSGFFSSRYRVVFIFGHQGSPREARWDIFRKAHLANPGNVRPVAFPCPDHHPW